ncbi:hypothetical protein CXB51_019436 [Gossypium anomalum]|uniref:Uncharacterized protein n=1 Tax=Gossypium anomalum TaxID=47600 RepID=A0A8J5YP59_9ROSI|nr:hypothetical protein CXB51_019436 [Gossypium anomalum]
MFLSEAHQFVGTRNDKVVLNRMKRKLQGATNEIINVASLLGNEGLEVVNPKELDNLLKEEGSRDNAKYSEESGSNNGEKKEDCICYKVYGILGSGDVSLTAATLIEIRDQQSFMELKLSF